MIKNWIITGDKHGAVYEALTVFARIAPEYIPSETGIIILGDVGLNFYLNKSEQKRKERINRDFEYHIYCVRGNHEERPERLGYERCYDKEISGEIYQDPYADNIRYLIDGEEYLFGEYSAIVIGGAYSVDKEYRINEAIRLERSFTGWYSSEQLTATEMDKIAKKVDNRHFDFVLTHTCPISWEPTDLFLSVVNQGTVDKTMELWFDDIKDTFSWHCWCFGHYHDDRIERPGVEMFYTDYADIEDLWHKWGEGNGPEWHEEKSPHYYWGV